MVGVGFDPTRTIVSADATIVFQMFPGNHSVVREYIFLLLQYLYGLDIRIEGLGNMHLEIKSLPPETVQIKFNDKLHLTFPSAFTFFSTLTPYITLPL